MQVKMQRGPDGQVQSRLGRGRNSFTIAALKQTFVRTWFHMRKIPRGSVHAECQGFSLVLKDPEREHWKRGSSKGPTVQVFGAVHWKGDRFGGAQTLLLTLYLGLTPGGAQEGQIWNQGIKNQCLAPLYCLFCPGGLFQGKTWTKNLGWDCFSYVIDTPEASKFNGGSVKGSRSDSKFTFVSPSL